MLKLSTNCVLVLAFVFFSVAACASKSPRLQESGSAAGVPSDYDQPFGQYVAESRKNIEKILTERRFINGKSPYLGEYTAAEAAEMRGPFEIPAENDGTCQHDGLGKGKGFLLIHGLTDSPYLMRSISASLHNAYPCGLIRAVLLPGHGTIAGDSLEMNHQQWMAITDYGVHSFEKMENISDLYLVGFSTGTALAIRQLQDGRESTKIQGLILLSTAVKANTATAFLSPYLRLVKDWLSKFKERDAARYESFSVNAGAEFYLLTKDIMKSKYTVDIPVLMAVSGDDATIDADAARQFFCDRTTSEKRALIWYQSRHQQKNITPPCIDIKEIPLGSIDRDFEGTHYRFANYAHTALSMSPSDPHYGVNGKYHHCKAYDDTATKNDFENCQKGSAMTIYGEKDIASDEAKKELNYDYWRRGTFNPDYSQLERAMVCFVNADCDLKKVLDE